MPSLRWSVLSMTLVVLSMGMTVMRRDIEWLGLDGIAVALLITALVYINVVVWRYTPS